MGGKKKAPAKKKGGGGKDDEEDVSVDQFYKFYKKKCNELACPFAKNMKEKYDEYLEEGTLITKFHTWEELGWAGVRAMMDALKQANYQHAKSVMFWKTFCEDEGVRAIVSFVSGAKSVTVLDLLDNMITPLGCEFVSNLMMPKTNSNIMVLKLDHNMFGSQGITNLAVGLAMNKTIQTLSLTYCNIDAKGARGIFEILIY